MEQESFIWEVGKIGDDQLFYLMSHGLTETEALNAIVMGFMVPFTKELPNGVRC